MTSCISSANFIERINVKFPSQTTFQYMKICCQEKTSDTQRLPLEVRQRNYYLLSPVYRNSLVIVPMTCITYNNWASEMFMKYLT